nr:CMF_HP1_G0048210.mRNA.1.CDS.1 [Saccharomyces cerevisiae]
MKRSVSYAQHSMMLPISDQQEPQTSAWPNDHSDPSCPYSRHHHRRNSVAVKFDKPLYETRDSQLSIRPSICLSSHSISHPSSIHTYIHIQFCVVYAAMYIYISVVLYIHY